MNNMEKYVLSVVLNITYTKPRINHEYFIEEIRNNQNKKYSIQISIVL